MDKSLHKRTAIEGYITVHTKANRLSYSVGLDDELELRLTPGLFSFAMSSLLGKLSKSEVIDMSRQQGLLVRTLSLSLKPRTKARPTMAPLLVIFLRQALRSSTVPTTLKAT